MLPAVSVSSCGVEVLQPCCVCEVSVSALPPPVACCCNLWGWAWGVELMLPQREVLEPPHIGCGVPFMACGGSRVGSGVECFI